MRAVGQWNTAWDPFLEVDPMWTDEFMATGIAIYGCGERFKSMPLIWSTLYKSFAFLVLLLVLNALEEIVRGLIQGRSTADSLAEFGGGTDRDQHRRY